ncbi:tetratricopeptide repeat protein [Mycobacteroides chelonae]|uniref:tetratricopeptide repeat protein n=1 Tax=Mycobacteroides chelonae TaxID=1774 RepID=UPI0009930803|nr:tetratricopeptide repeat protein [Mycobacteroides chelonae]
MTGLFFGVGVGTYSDAGLGDLPDVGDEVQLVSELIGDHFEVAVLRNASESEVVAGLKRYQGHFSQIDGALVVMWSGHGQRGNPDELRLLASDSADNPTGGFAASEIAGKASATGASQILMIVDTCYAGRALALPNKVLRDLRECPPAGTLSWCGVLVACGVDEVVPQGSLAEVMQRLLRQGPRPGNSHIDQDLRRLWSERNRLIDGDVFCKTVIRELQTSGVLHNPDRASAGFALPMIQNPLWRPAAAPATVQEVLTDSYQEQPFYGRDCEVAALTEWLSGAKHGTFVISGAAGAGKSAVINRGLSVSGRTIFGRNGDDGGMAGAVIIESRGLNADSIAQSIDNILTDTGLLEDMGFSRNVFEVCGAFQRLSDDGADLPVVVLDSFEETTELARAIDDLVAPLAKVTKVIVGTRPTYVGDAGRLQLSGSGQWVTATGTAGQAPIEAMLTLPEQILDLNDQRHRQSGWQALRLWLHEALSDMPDNVTIAAEVFASLQHEAREEDQPPLVLAGLLIDHLRTSGAQAWLERPSLAHSVGAALEEWLGDHGAKTLQEGAVHPLLRALACGAGAGLPEREWLLLANAASSGERPAGHEEIAQLLAKMGKYIVEDSESGQAVYRFAHQLIAQHFAEPWDEQFASFQLSRARVLVEAALELNPANATVHSPHLKQYLASYVAAAGEDGLTLLIGKETLAPVFVSGCMLVSTHYARQRYLSDAARVMQHAVGACENYADRVERPTTALAYAQLAGIYRDLGNISSAIQLQSHAISLFSVEVQSRPDLVEVYAQALCNYAQMFIDAHEPQAVPVAQQAVEIWRQIVGSAESSRYRLGDALNVLSTAYSITGQPGEAVQASRRAVQLLQASRTDRDRAALGRALQNLGNRLGEAGALDEAVTASENSCQVWQELVDRDQIWMPELQGARSALAVAYGSVGRLEDARLIAEDLLSSYRELNSPTIADSINHARLLANFAHLLLLDGFADEARQHVTEAVSIMEMVVAEDNAHERGLAVVLNTYANTMGRLGYQRESLVAAERAVSHYRRARVDNPSLDASTAGMLLNYSSRLGDARKFSEAIAVAREAVDIVAPYRETEPVKYAIAVDATARIAADLMQLGQTQAAAEHASRAVREGEQLLAAGAIQAEKLGQIYSSAARAVHLDLPTTMRYLTRAAELLPLTGTPHQMGQYGRALRNLAAVEGQLGRIEEALAKCQRALTLFLRLVGIDSSYQSDLASTQAAYAKLLIAAQRSGGRDMALASVQSFQRIPELTFEQVVECGRALGVLASVLTQGSKDLTLLDQQVALCARPLHGSWCGAMYFNMSLQVAQTHTRVPWWYYQIWQALGEESGMESLEFRKYLRKIRAVDPVLFDKRWKEDTGAPLPGWVNVTPQQLISAMRWTLCIGYTQAEAFLLENPVITGQGSDESVREALAWLALFAPAKALALRTIRESSLAAEEPLLGPFYDLLNRFLGADLSGRLEIMSEHGETFSSGRALTYLAAWDTPPAHAALSLIALHQLDIASRLNAAVGGGECVDEFLASLAQSQEGDTLRHACVVLREHARQASSADIEVSAGFFLAVSDLVSGSRPEAAQELVHIVQNTPGHRDRWRRLLCEIASRRTEFNLIAEYLGQFDV